MMLTTRFMAPHGSSRFRLDDMPAPPPSGWDAARTQAEQPTLRPTRAGPYTQSVAFEGMASYRINERTALNKDPIAVGSIVF